MFVIVSLLRQDVSAFCLSLTLELGGSKSQTQNGKAGRGMVGSVRWRVGAGRDASLQQLLSHIAQSKPRVSDLSQVPLEIFIFFILCIWLFHHSWIFFYYTGGDTRVRDSGA